MHECVSEKLVISIPKVLEDNRCFTEGLVCASHCAKCAVCMNTC